MSFGPTVEWARRADTRWQRWLNPERRRVLINARTPMNYAVMAPIHQAMRSDRRVTFYFTGSQSPDRVPQIFREAGADARLVTSSRAMLMRFDAYLDADMLWLTLPRGTRRVQIFHGVAGKHGHIYDRPNRSMREWDRLFFINRRRLQNFIAAGAIDGESSAPRLVGMPRVDCRVDGSLRREAIFNSLGIDPGKRTVLYAPTWTPHCSLNAMGEELIEAISTDILHFPARVLVIQGGKGYSRVATLIPETVLSIASCDVRFPVRSASPVSTHGPARSPCSERRSGLHGYAAAIAAQVSHDADRLAPTRVRRAAAARDVTSAGRAD